MTSEKSIEFKWNWRSWKCYIILLLKMLVMCSKHFSVECRHFAASKVKVKIDCAHTHIRLLACALIIHHVLHSNWSFERLKPDESFPLWNMNWKEKKKRHRQCIQSHRMQWFCSIFISLFVSSLFRQHHNWKWCFTFTFSVPRKPKAIADMRRERDSFCTLDWISHARKKKWFISISISFFVESIQLLTKLKFITRFVQSSENTKNGKEKKLEKLIAIKKNVIDNE